jgi:hypothetical protein
MGPSLPHIHALSLPMGNGQPRALSPSHPHPLAAHGKRTATGPPSLTFTSSRYPRETDCHGLSLPHIHALSLPTGNAQPRALLPSHSRPLAAHGKRAATGPPSLTFTLSLPMGNAQPRAQVPSQSPSCSAHGKRNATGTCSLTSTGSHGAQRGEESRWVRVCGPRKAGGRGRARGPPTTAGR